MSALVATHAFAAGVGLFLGGWQLFVSRKGSVSHRLAGRVWVVALLYVSVSSFWIREIRDGTFSLLHVLSVVTIVTVALGLWNALRGRVQAHRANMAGSWLGLVGAGIAASAVPQRDLPQLVVNDPLRALGAVLMVLATTAAVVAAGGAVARWNAPRDVLASGPPPQLRTETHPRGGGDG